MLWDSGDPVGRAKRNGLKKSGADLVRARPFWLRTRRSGVRISPGAPLQSLTLQYVPNPSSLVHSHGLALAAWKHASVSFSARINGRKWLWFMTVNAAPDD